MKKIAIGTLNKAKIEAAKRVFDSVWPGCEFVSQEINSEVSGQPSSAPEAILGATNRAQNVFSYFPEADYFIGLEGYVENIGHDMFLGGCAVIISRDHKIGKGFSALAQIPDLMAEKINAGQELGPLARELFSDEDNLIRQTIGTNGVLTKKLYTRVDEFEDAIRCALARFVSPEHY